MEVAVDAPFLLWRVIILSSKASKLGIEIIEH
jgi:hypothetical protein